MKRRRARRHGERWAVGKAQILLANTDPVYRFLRNDGMMASIGPESNCSGRLQTFLLTYLMIGSLEKKR